MFFLLLLPALLQRPPAPVAAAPAKPATIRGKVTAADTGAPVKRALITLRPNSRPLEPVTVTADAQGVYEAKNLEPGTYMASCSKTGYVTTSYKAKRAGQEGETLILSDDGVMKDVDFQLPRGAAIAGTISDEDGEPVSGVSVQAMAKVFNQGKAKLESRTSAKTDDRGNYRLYDLPPGRYYVQAGGKSIMDMAMSMTQGSAPPAPYSIVIYPSATRTNDAQAITLQAGAEVAGINMQMRGDYTYKVSGKIMDMRSAKPMAGAVVMVSGEDMMQSMGTPTQTRPDGTFHLAPLAPGHYQMMIVDPANATKGGMPLIRGFDVGAADVTNLNINVGPGSVVKGKLKADGGTVPEKSRVSLMPKSGSSPMPGGFATTNADASFEIENVQPGTYTLQVQAVNPGANPETTGFYLRDITVSDQDVTETGIVVPEYGNVEMSAMLDFRAGRISGNVTDEDGQPLHGAAIVLVSSDAKKREGDRYFKRVTSDSKGVYKMPTVIPGDYYLVIWAEDHPGQLQDPDVFQLVEKYAVSVTVQGSALATQDLKLSKELRTVAQTFAQ